MPKLTLNPPPTWQAPVSIPTPEGIACVAITFKRRNRDELIALTEQIKALKDAAAVELVVLGWDLEDDVNAANIARLCNTYPGAGHAILQTYLLQSMGRSAAEFLAD